MVWGLNEIKPVRPRDTRLPKPREPMPEQKQWPNEFKSSKDVASAINWVRWKTKGGALLIVAFGVNSVCAAMDEKLDPEDAIAMLELERETLDRLLRYLKDSKQTYHYAPRPNR